MDENKQKALAAALGQIEKQFGKGSIMRLGDNRAMDVETISTLSVSGYRVGCWWSTNGTYR